MSAEDVKINGDVRRVFPQLWIDLSSLMHRTVKGHVYVFGRIVKTGGTDADGDAQTMAHLHDRLLAIEGVQGVVYSLDNWSFDGMNWKLIGGAKRRAKQAEEKEQERRAAIRQAAIDQLEHASGK